MLKRNQRTMLGGQDERVRVQDFYDGVEYNYKLMQNLAPGK